MKNNDNSWIYDTTFYSKARAKINLSLRILGRREDSYHLLEMLNAPLSLSDIISVKISKEPESRLVIFDQSSDVPLSFEDNLVGQAFNALTAKLDLKISADIKLWKKIPSGAGLGGGSSDAAALLNLSRWIFDRYFNLRITNEEFAKLALSLGADTPYFLDPRPSWVRGVGELISKSDLDLLDTEVILVLPEFKLSTDEVYKAYVKQSPELPSEAEYKDTDELILENDLYDAALSLKPELKQIKEALLGLDGCRLGFTGSGSTFFLLPNESKVFPGGGLTELERLTRRENLAIIRTKIEYEPMLS